MPEGGDRLQLEEGAGRDRGLEGPRQSYPAPRLLGLPATRACHPRRRQPSTHVTDHAVVSLSPVQNPGQVRSATVSLKPRCKYASKGDRDLSGMIPDEGSVSGHASVVSRMGLREPNHNGGASGSFAVGTGIVV